MFLSYDEYKNLGGELLEAAFLPLERKAERKINYITFNRVAEFEVVPEAVKTLTADIIPLVEVIEAEKNGSKAKSYSNDGVSVSYVVPTATEAEDQILSLAYEALARLKTPSGVPLIFSGVSNNG